jgi:FkbM family methyltransferase
MINRSKIKYILKKKLPSGVFALIYIFWAKILLKIINKVDFFRLKNFTKKTSVILKHKDIDFELFLSPENGFIDKHIFLYGVYEPFMFDLFLRYLKTGDTFIDIGANIGQHTIFAAKIVGEEGSVHAFEPIPKLYNQLKDSVELNHLDKYVFLHNVAIGPKEGQGTFYVSKNAGGSSFVNKDDLSETITVSIKNGDTYLSPLKKIDAIKIDVEGFEYEVLLGVKKIIETYRPILFLEFSGHFYTQQGNQSGEKILSLLRSYNYSIFDIEDNFLEIKDDKHFNSLISLVRKQTNLLCISKE